ncbi:hypothetical protein BurJ1DRAFT_4706 [Burkholderiales bacterium JOSHI_001]|nr:hypothetical protein BurJ1DRAFT_4706 [Burkholderiales bacterium JOSHI_001]
MSFHRDLALALTGTLLALALPAASARSFQAEGADTGAGLGARYVAQGGTGVATSDDVHALYFNPAGLVGVQGFELSVSRQLNQRLRPINFLGAAWRLPLPQALGWKATAAAAFYPRIHARASGAFDDSDFESLFLRYLLPGIDGTFDGDVNTKTKSWRLGLGLAPLQDSPWSGGLYLERIDCRSDFCGVHATSNGFTTSSTGAKATGVGAGLRYRWDEGLSFGASLSDLRTRLSIQSTTTDNAGTRSSVVDGNFPRKLVLGAAWRWRADTTAAADFEVMKGRYGQSSIDLRVLRLGLEQRRGPWAWRGGAVLPLKIDSSNTGRLHAPFPFAPTLGGGWRGAHLKVDLAIYVHAVMSMHKDRASPAADLSLSLDY